MEQSIANMVGVKPYVEKPENLKGQISRYGSKRCYFILSDYHKFGKRHQERETNFLKKSDDERDPECYFGMGAFRIHMQNYILNGQDDSLYDICTECKTAKELQESLEKKYKSEDAGAKKFAIGKFLKFNMVDEKSVVSQAKEHQNIIHEL